MQTLRAIDYGIFRVFNGLAGHSAFLNDPIIIFAKYVPYLVVAILLIVILKSRADLVEKVRAGAVIYGSAILAWLSTNIIRLFYHRPRPFLAHTVNQLLSETNYSFPSGHATFFFALGFAVFFYNRKWGWWFLLAALVIGLARVAAGIHYPSDIIGGLIVGLIFAFILRKFLPRKTI